MMHKNKAILIIIMITIFAGFSYWYSAIPGMGDFSVFYRASKIIMNPDISNLEIYNPDALNAALDGTKNNNILYTYRYSQFATYLMVPLAFLNFRNAEAIFIFLNLICYAVSMFIILKSLGASNRWFLYPYAGSFLWIPFIKNIQFGQINAILFLFLILAISTARKDNYVLSGILLALGTLFKPFSLAMTMVFGIKNWRIFVSCVTALLLALLLPGTASWFHSFLWPPHSPSCYSAFYNFLMKIDVIYFVVYVLAVGLITASVTYLNRQLDYLDIASLAIPGAFLTMPVLEPHHLTILIFCYAYFIYQKSNFNEKFLIAVSFVLVNLGSVINEGMIFTGLGIFILWIVMILIVIKKGRSYKEAACVLEIEGA